MNVLMKFQLFFLIFLINCEIKELRAEAESTNNKIDLKLFFEQEYKSSNSVINREETSMIFQNGGHPAYGEILYSSLELLLNELNIQPTDIFYDLGSGLGKVILQAYFNYPFKKTVGIELSPTRYQHAINKIKILNEKNYLDSQRTLEFINANIVDTDLSDATIVFMCSTCYSNDLMEKISIKLSSSKKGLKVITLKDLPASQKDKFELIKQYKLPMTWTKASSVFLYELK